MLSFDCFFAAYSVVYHFGVASLIKANSGAILEKWYMTSGLNKPIYVRIQEYIAELILSGKLAPDSKIPSERDFSEDLGVSRMTVRKAITELVSEGLLERRHGSGTYVARPGSPTPPASW